MQKAAPNDVIPTGSGLYTVPEVARRLRVSPQSVYGWVKRNLLPAMRLPGGKIRIRNRHVREIEEQ